MGWSPFKTRDQLLVDKLGYAEYKDPTPAMERGIYLEDGIRRWLCDKEGLTLDPIRSNGMWVWDEDERCSYNADGVTTDDSLIEIKCTAERVEENGWGRQGKNSDAIPDTYKAQVMWGMGIFGLSQCWVGVLSGAPRFEFARYRVKYDQSKFEELLVEVYRFLDDLDKLKAEQPAWLTL
jgi:putative phage-type endonuclease